MFLSVDTLSARHMSLYGYARSTTPGIERIAQESVVFERCWANAPWTTPSYMSQFTGLYPAAFLRPDDAPPAESPWVFSEEHTTIAELFRSRGYRTAAFIDNHNIGPHLGFEQGFEVYDDSAAYISIDEPGGGIDHIVPRALAWLDGLGEDEPFFLFMQVLDVHGPYLSAGAFEGSLENTPTPIAHRLVPIALEHEAILGAIPRYIAEPHLERHPDELDVRPLADDYDEGILAMDKAISLLWDQLAERGTPEDAYFVLSADHGESLVEHDSFFDHQLLHGQELHVPLLVRPPGGCEALSVKTNVQLIDLYPTFVDWIDARGHPGGHGRSLAPAIAGEVLAQEPSFAFGDFQASRCVLSKGWKLLETNPSIASSGVVGFMSSTRTRAWIRERFPEHAGKAYGTHQMPPSVLQGVDLTSLWEEAREALSGPFYELYNIEEDPDELSDLAAQFPDRVQALRALLEAAGKQARACFLPAERGPAFLDGPQRDELQKLGY